MHQKLEATCKGEGQAVSNTEVEIAELERNHEVTVKDLNVEANSQIQWFWKELNLTRSQNKWLWKELRLALDQMQDDGFSRQDDKIH